MTSRASWGDTLCARSSPAEETASSAVKAPGVPVDAARRSTTAAASSFTIFCGTPSQRTSTSRRSESAAARASMIPERSRAVSSRLLASATCLRAEAVRKSALSLAASSWATCTSFRGTRTAARRSRAEQSTSHESSRPSSSRMRTTRRRTSRREGDARKSQAREGVPATESATRASASLAPERCMTSSKATLGAMVRNGTT